MKSSSSDIVAKEITRPRQSKQDFLRNNTRQGECSWVNVVLLLMEVWLLVMMKLWWSIGGVPQAIRLIDKTST